MQSFLHPYNAIHKIWSSLANWLQRYSSSNVWKFRHSRASMSGLIRSKIELDRALMPVLVSSNFDDDSIKNERASMETALSRYKSMGKSLDAQGQLTPKSVVRSCRNAISSEILCMSSLAASIKTNRENVDIVFPIIRQWGISVAMIQSVPKPCAAFPPPQWSYT